VGLADQLERGIEQRLPPFFRWETTRSRAGSFLRAALHDEAI